MTRDAHATTDRTEQEPLYDPNVPTPSHAERARTLAGTVTTGTVCTVAREPEGHPYGSFVTVAFDGNTPVFLFSELAEHTRNLRHDSRASLLVAEDEAEDPLANGRVTLVGSCSAVTDDGGRSRTAFLTTHPRAEYYADFKDFAFWRLEVESVRYIGGYGRMSWVDPSEWAAATADPLAPAAGGILRHMNADHGDALLAYCHAFSRAADASSAQMTGIDRYGFEMSAVTGAGPRPIRLAFAEPVAGAEDARRALIALAKEARATLAGG